MKFSRIYFVFIFISFISCNQQTEKKQLKPNEETSKTVKYAKGFDIIQENGVTKLIIKSPYQNAKEHFTYILGDKTDLSKNQLKVPLNSIVVTSTTHIPMLEMLGEENKLIGYPHTKYISSEKTRERIKENKVEELGLEQNINTEKLMNLNPDLVVGFSLNGNNKTYTNIVRAGIPMIYNGDWLEETPLGRAEWIKFFGVLFGKEKEAEEAFKEIEQSYIQARSIAKSSKRKPTVIGGSLFKDVWYVPAGGSFIATFFKDANLSYPWNYTEGNGSVPLSFESVYEKGSNADFWIGCGLFSSKTELISANENYKEFDTFKNNKIYTMANKKGETGGIIYFELSPVRPDLVLKDIIKITNPDLLPNYTLTFYELLQ